jgi:hypothetical protein
MGMWDWSEGQVLPDEDVYCDVGSQERVLVAVVPSARDWAQVCAERWYRIPLARAPRHIAADYLAFYHLKCIAATRWTIPCYAPIRGYQVLSRRALLSEEPNHPRADALYYRIDIGDLVALPQPIPSARLRRITFIETTLPRLLQAREVGDLWLRQPPSLGRWRALQLGEPGPARAYGAL